MAVGHHSSGTKHQTSTLHGVKQSIESISEAMRYVDEVSNLMVDIAVTGGMSRRLELGKIV